MTTHDTPPDLTPDLATRLAGLSDRRRALLEARLGRRPAGTGVATAAILADIDAWADRRPDAEALWTAAGTLTFRALRDRSSERAATLRRGGLTSGQAAAVALAAHPDGLVELLALLKAGARPMPVATGEAPSWTAERLALLAESAPEAALLVAGLEPSAQAGDDATDGWLEWRDGVAALTPGDGVLAVADPPWAATASEWLWPLARGARLVLAEPGTPLRGLIAAQAVRVAQLAPSRLAACLSENPGPLPAGLATVLCGGEALAADIARALSAAAPGARLVHFHAPVAAPPVAAGSVDFGALRGDAVSAGLPTAEGTIHILDPGNRPVPGGVVGRIGLVLRDRKGEPRRLLTGDTGRRHRDGTLDIVGSVGGTVWTRGQLCDPAATARALAALPEVADAHMLIRGNAEAGSQRIAYVVPVGGHGSATIARAAGVLPTVLRPDSVVVIAALPLTAAGTVDEASLAALPVIDDATIRQWESALAALPGVAEAAVLPLPATPAPRPPYRLGDFLSSPGGMAGEGANDDAPATTPAAAPAAAPAAIESHGPPLPDELAAPNLPALLRIAARLRPDHGVRILDAAGGSSLLPYPALQDKAARVLTGLRRQGCRPGDPVLLQLGALDDYLIGFWACLLGGLVPVPVSLPPTWQEENAAIRKLSNVWRMLDRPRILAGAAEMAGLAEAAGLVAADPPFDALPLPSLLEEEPAADWHEAGTDDIALLLLTSGSTGTPKAVTHTHRTLLSRCASIADHHGFGEDEVSLNWLPLDHVGAVVMFHLRDVFLRCQQIHAPIDAVLAEPLRWLDWIDRHRVTVTWAPNFAFALVNARAGEIAERRWDLSCLRVLINAGESIVPRTARRFLSLLTPHGLPTDAMKPEWGMSETSSAVVGSAGFTLAGTSDRDGFVDLGEPMPGTSLRIVDAHATASGRPAIGRLQVRGRTVTPGYLRNDEANRESFTADGWFDTGDLGFLADGRLTITGRAKDSVIVNGLNLYSHEIEALVEEVPGVAVSFTAACAHRPAGADTDELTIFFAPADSGRPLAELASRIRAHVVRQTGVNPSHLVPVEPEEVPKTAIGKIQRAQLAARFAAGDFAGRLAALEPAPAADGVPDGFATLLWRRAEIRPAPSGTAADPVILRADDGASDPLTALAARLRGLSENRRDGDGVHLAVVTCGGVATTADEAADLRTATLPGWLKSAMAELPWLHARQIDFDTVPAREELTALVRREMADTGNDPLVAYRHGRRLAPRLTRIDLRTHRQQHQAFPLRRKGLMLLAGGLGGVGARVAEALAARFGARLLLLGRRDAAGEPNLATRLAALRSAGADVDYAVCDITDEGALRRVVAEAERRCGHPLTALFHMAGEVNLRDRWDGTGRHGVLTGDEAGLERDLSAKVAGTRALLSLIDGRPDVAFIAFSSVNGEFGAASLAGYAAANGFLAAACHEHRRRGHPLTWCFDWPMWDGLGMAEGLPEPVRERSRAMGYRILPPETAIESLLIGLSTDVPRLLVGIEDSHPSWRRAGAAATLPAERLFGFIAGNGAGTAGALPVRDRFGKPVPCAVTALESLPRMADGTIDRTALAGQGHGGAGPAGAEPATEWEKRVAAVWRELLRLETVGIHENFFELGGHSLLLAQVRARLTALAGRDVPMVALFRHSTIHALARHLSGAGADTEDAVPAAAPPGVAGRGDRLLEQRRRRTAAFPGATDPAAPLPDPV